MQHFSVESAIDRVDLHLLGFRDDVAADVRRLAAELAEHPRRRERVEALVEVLRASVGDFFAELPVADGAGPAGIEDGLVTLLALVAVAPEAHAEYVRRGVPSDVAWRSLSDLGQQVHLFRRIVGFTGLGAQGWCAQNFTGRHLWLGRLQFTLERGDGGDHVLGVHIPATGPLTPEAVDDSFRRAVRLSATAYPEYDVARMTLHSWMLDRRILDELRPESNLVRFADRFDPVGEPEPGWRDLLFFGFDVEPRLQPVDLSALPGRTSLHRAMLRRLDRGDAGVFAGVLRDWPPVAAD